MKGKRIFDRFGFNLPKQPQQKSNTKLVVYFENWTFPEDSSDWVNDETGEALTKTVFKTTPTIYLNFQQ
ncbi:MAG: hypothetical protein GQ525_11705 [Draconibacterium sp.]|nr:hypothetical protein [Draconibacterium sp.]